MLCTPHCPPLHENSSLCCAYIVHWTIFNPLFFYLDDNLIRFLTPAKTLTWIHHGLSNQGRMSPPIDRPKHAVWDVFGYLLGHQIRLTCALSKPTIDIDDDDLADMLHHLIGNLARGYNMKEIYRTVDPCLKSQQQRAIFSELCRWIFSTQGVLSTLYQPLISQNAEAEDQNTMEEVVVQANEGKYSVWLSRTHITDRLLLS